MMMSEAINPILQWLNANPHAAGLVTFLISAAESIAIIGTIVPGTIMMTALGALAGVGVIPLWSTIIWAILGAIVGDNFSFFIGHHYKEGLRDSWVFRHYPQLLNSGEKFFIKYGIMSVFIGRFIGPVRALVPIVAGMLKMKPLRYVTVSIIASIMWAPVYMLPGILLGEAALEFPPDVAIHVVLVLLFSALFIIFCVWMVYKIFVLVRNRINHMLNTLWQHLQRSRYFRVFTLVLKHHDPAKTHGQLILAFYFILSCALFLYLVGYVTITPSSDITINNIMFYLFRSLRSATMDSVMLCFTMLGDKKVLIPAFVAIIAWLCWKKRWNTAAHALALFILTCASIVFFKHIVHSERPWGILHSPDTFSFPSGHSTMSMTFYLGLALLLIHGAKFECKRLIYILMAILIGAISFSRLYLGAHWFTDLIGGWLLSASLLMLISLSYNRLPERQLKAAGIILIVFITVMVGASYQIIKNGATLTQNYAQIDWPVTTLKMDSWWQQDGDNLPTTRIGRIGLNAELFNLQWIGDIDDIKAMLLTQAWSEPPPQEWVAVLHRITDVSSAEHFPLVSPLYLDKKPALVLVKHYNGEKKLMVLRLWTSHVNIAGASQPLWVGSIGPAPRTYSWLITYKKNKNYTITTALLFKQIPAGLDVKEIPVSVHVKRKHRWTQQTMILIRPKTFS
jgi:membrane protein DedA with SNARE-associated domain/membrane-associated phospholipid phosphatase